MAADNPGENTSPNLTTQSGPFITYTPPTMDFSSTSSTTPRRSTITGFRPLPTPPQATALPLPVTIKDGACTHMSVTRLYTTDFSCQVCGEYGSMGWIFRCIQDRENMIEHDLGVGVYDKIDSLCDILKASNNPKKRSPAARESPLSLLDEMTEAQLATYTPAQISILLKQRANLQKVLATTNALHAQTHAAQALHHLQQQFGLTPAPSGTPPSNTTFQFLPTPSPLKPWVPLKECQFKSCARCRSSFREKSYLRLDAILNNDIPATAAMGFGFNLIGARPVAPAEIVKNLGLRPNPEPHDNMSGSSPYVSDTESEASSSSPELTMAQLPLNIRRRLANLNLYDFGLGIDPDGKATTNPIPRPKTPTSPIFSADEAAASSSFPTSNAKDKHPQNPASNWYTHPNHSASSLKSKPPTGSQTQSFALPSSSSFTHLNQVERIQEPRPRPSTMPIRRPTGYPRPRIVLTNEEDVVGDADVDTSDTAYDSEEDSEVESEVLRRGREVAMREVVESRRSVMFAGQNEAVKMETLGQNGGVKPELERKEDDEDKGNTFSCTPVSLKDGGVAVTEEAVEEGVPDVVVR